MKYQSIIIDFNNLPLISRPFYAIAIFIEYLARMDGFVKEYLDYSKKGIFYNWQLKLDFILNHTIFLPFYFLWAIIFGRAKSFTYKIPKVAEK